ncbi:hypothetical protein ISN45_At03g030920, partial [Arabidopsis thaliana x Arabidopsis arenosa]
GDSEAATERRQKEAIVRKLVFNETGPPNCPYGRPLCLRTKLSDDHLTALTISISSAQTVNNAHPDNNVLVEYDPSRSIPPPPPSKIYKVGDSKGWSVSQEKISRDLEFISCDPTSPVAMHKTGHDLVKLTKPGVHYFITSMTTTTLPVPSLECLLSNARLDLSYKSWSGQSPR